MNKACSPGVFFLFEEEWSLMTTSFFSVRRIILGLAYMLFVVIIFAASADAATRMDMNREEYQQHETIIEVIATGYTAGKESTGKSPDHPQYGVTFSGVMVCRAQVSTIAADPSIFPIGSLLYIPGYGYGVVADTGGAIKGNKIDLYFETIEDVYSQWGKRTVHVQLIKRGDGKLTQQWLDEINQTIEVDKPIPQHFLES